MSSVAAHLPFIAVAHGAGNDRVLLRRAVEAQVDFVEADVWPRGDGIVAHHERRIVPLPILFEKWYLKLDFRPVWLEEIADAAIRSGVRVYADVKLGGREFVKRVVDALRRGHAIEGAVLSGHHWDDLVWARTQAPVDVFPSVSNVRDLARFWRFEDRPGVHVDGIAIRHGLVTPEVVESCRMRGLRVLPWTVDHQARARDLVDLGVDGMISNHVALLRESGRWAARLTGESDPWE